MTKLSKSAALVVCAGLAVSACSSGGSGTKGASGGANVATAGILAGAYQKVLAVHSADLALTLKVSTATGTTENITATGAMQWQPLLGQLSMSIPIGGSTPTTLTYRIIGDDMYIQIPQAMASDLGGKTWIEGSLSSLAGSSSDEINPTDTLSLLAGQASSIEPVGTGDVDGVATTEYSADIDLTKAVSSLGTGALSKLAPTLRQMLGTDTLPVDVWVDGSGRLVKMAMSLTLKNAPSGASAQVSSAFPVQEAITETLSNYGAAVSVAAPPADQTQQIDLGQILGSSGL